jgi:hypothetical protein
MVKNKNEKALTLSQLVEYNNEVLFPALEERFNTFATKDDLKNYATQNSVNELLVGQAEILKEIRDLKGEKTIGDAQDKRRTDVLKIHNKALKKNKILSKEEALQIDQMGAL